MKIIENKINQTAATSTMERYSNAIKETKTDVAIIVRLDQVVHQVFI